MEQENEASFTGMERERFLVIEVDKLGKLPATVDELVEQLLLYPEAVNFNQLGGPDEYFVLKIKDEFARSALVAYARSAILGGMVRLGQRVSHIAERAGLLSVFRKRPD